MTALDFIGAGGHFEYVDGRLVALRPRGRDDLLDSLRAEVARRVPAMAGEQLPRPPADCPRSGRCYSCNDPREPHQGGDCPLCILARRKALEGLGRLPPRPVVEPPPGSSSAPAPGAHRRGGMKALSIRQPWAWAILHAGKRIENRSRADGRMPSLCSHRGPLLLHASIGCTQKEFDAALGFMAAQGLPWKDVPVRKELLRGGVVGVCNVVNAIDPEGRVLRGGVWTREPKALAGIDVRWHEPGSYGLVLDNVRPLPFVPFSGSLGLFDVPESAVSL